MKNFELFMGCLGNGITVCNKAVMECGDFKKVAHISDAGNITWYVNAADVPGDALLRIEHEAQVMESKFMTWLDALPKINRYSYLLDKAPLHILLVVANGKCKYTLEEKIAILKKSVLPLL